MIFTLLYALLRFYLHVHSGHTGVFPHLFPFTYQSNVGHDVSLFFLCRFNKDGGQSSENLSRSKV